MSSPRPVETYPDKCAIRAGDQSFLRPVADGVADLLALEGRETYLGFPFALQGIRIQGLHGFSVRRAQEARGDGEQPDP